MNQYVYFFCTLCVAFAGVRCTRQEAVIPKKVETIQQLPDLSARKSAYQLLTDAEKVTLWKTHLQAMQAIVTTPEQKQLIREAFSFLTEQAFASHRNAEGNTFEKWRYRASKAFTARQLSLVFSDVGNVSQAEFVQYSAQPSITNASRTQLRLPDCDCHPSTAFDFCSRFDTHFGDLNYEYRCEAPCEKSTETSWKCGWFWSQSCTKTCKEYFYKTPL